jgi:hypothetical protein
MADHYGELTRLFDAWRNRWTEQYRTYQFLPIKVANAFQIFLGCPEYFDVDEMTGTKRDRYVSPARAVWDEEQGLFRLNAYESLIEDVYFHEDGYCYFGLRVILEHGPRASPKLPFWFLLRAKIENNDCVVIEQRSGKEFHIQNDRENALEALFSHIMDLLKSDLSETPIERALRQRKEKFRVGFIKTDS